MEITVRLAELIIWGLVVFAAGFAVAAWLMICQHIWIEMDG